MKDKVMLVSGLSRPSILALATAAVARGASVFVVDAPTEDAFDRESLQREAAATLKEMVFQLEKMEEDLPAFRLEGKSRPYNNRTSRDDRRAARALRSMQPSVRYRGYFPRRFG